MKSNRKGGLECPECGAHTRIQNTRYSKQTKQRIQYHVCDCGFRHALIIRFPCEMYENVAK